MTLEKEPTIYLPFKFSPCSHFIIFAISRCSRRSSKSHRRFYHSLHLLLTQNYWRKRSGFAVRASYERIRAEIARRQCSKRGMHFRILCERHSGHCSCLSLHSCHIRVPHQSTRPSYGTALQLAQAPDCSLRETRRHVSKSVLALGLQALCPDR